jgi:oxygen-independent coproporphyrinogen-3 oxidase
MPLALDDGTVGVYLHIPFCDRVCPYCDFAVVAARGGPSAETEARYVAALEAELVVRAPAFEGRRLASIYFGGGTPALLEPGSLARLVEGVRARFASALGSGAAPAADAEPPVEITLEVNPSTVERTRLAGFRDAGVNRVSVGVQSFDDGVLKRLGRAHKASEASLTLEAARAAGFDNLSIDLMFAVPGQTRAMLARDLAETARHAPEHVSTYELVIEAGTPFEAAARRGRLPAFDHDLAAILFEDLEAGLEAQGMAAYELTNHARPGFESQHNARYWARRPVLGLGVGAWSFDPPGEGRPHGARPANVRALGEWLDAVESGRSAARHEDRPDRRQAMAEAVFLALRCRQGLDPAAFSREFGASPQEVFGVEIAELSERAWLEEDASGALVLTRAGRMMADSVCERFV